MPHEWTKSSLINTLKVLEVSGNVLLRLGAIVASIHQLPRRGLLETHIQLCASLCDRTGAMPALGTDRPALTRCSRKGT